MTRHARLPHQLEKHIPELHPVWSPHAVFEQAGQITRCEDKFSFGLAANMSSSNACPILGRELRLSLCSSLKYANLTVTVASPSGRSAAVETAPLVRDSSHSHEAGERERGSSSCISVPRHWGSRHGRSMIQAVGKSCQATDDSRTIYEVRLVAMATHEVLALVKNRYDIFTEPQGKTFACRNALRLQRPHCKQTLSIERDPA